jgi:hypothetical protein
MGCNVLLIKITASRRSIGLKGDVSGREAGDIPNQLFCDRSKITRWSPDRHMVDIAATTQCDTISCEKICGVIGSVEHFLIVSERKTYTQDDHLLPIMEALTSWAKEAIPLRGMKPLH